MMKAVIIMTVSFTLAWSVLADEYGNDAEAVIEYYAQENQLDSADEQLLAMEQLLQVQESELQHSLKLDDEIESKIEATHY